MRDNCIDQLKYPLLTLLKVEQHIDRHIVDDEHHECGLIKCILSCVGGVIVVIKAYVALASLS